MGTRRLLPWYFLRPLLGGLFGFLGGIYFMFTGESMGWRASGEPLLPVGVLFDVHPVVGLGVFTALGIGFGWLEWYVERRL